jgi:hypothetical protein
MWLYIFHSLVQMQSKQRYLCLPPFNSALSNAKLTSSNRKKKRNFEHLHQSLVIVKAGNLLQPLYPLHGFKHLFLLFLLFGSTAPNQLPHAHQHMLSNTPDACRAAHITVVRAVKHIYAPYMGLAISLPCKLRHVRDTRITENVQPWRPTTALHVMKPLACAS